MTISRAAVLGSAKTLSAVLIGPAGIPSLHRLSIQKVLSRRRKIFSRSGISSPRFFTRSGLVANRPSEARSRTPAMSQNFRHWPSFPIPTAMWRSFARNTW